MVKSSIDVDLDDPRCGKIATAISNKTCKKILALLAEEELSEGDIAERLNIPLNTVGYNIKKLQESGLVVKSKNFFWSSKGKKIPTYKVSHKRIVISPVSMTKRVLPVVLILGIAALVLFASFTSQDGLGDGKGAVNLPGAIDNILNSEDDEIALKRFASYDELKEFLDKNSDEATNRFGLFGSVTATQETVAAASSADSSDGADDYSQTNVQVSGVDELDIVKNDGKYIYSIVQNKVVIVNAFPADEMKVVSEVEFEERLLGIFVNGDKLIVLASDYGYYYGYAGVIEEDSLDDEERQGPQTKVYVYDITDRSNPSMAEEFSVSGSYNSARMIEDYVYVISTNYIDPDSPVLPVFSSGSVERSVEATDILYPDVIDSGFVFSSVMAIDIDELAYEGDVFLTGGSGTMYVSKDNIYLSHMKKVDWRDFKEEYYENVILASVSGKARDDIEEILESDGEFYEKSREIDDAMAGYFNSLNKDEREKVFEKMQKASEEHSLEWSKEHEKTVIHKIGIDEMEIDYDESGMVPGRILHQFSMDEFEGNLRIATTTGDAWGARAGSLNHLYVLDADLEIIGSVEDLAKGERIYSARFLGDKAYMVTFRQVDPLYVIDVSNPKNPEVLGFLKVTGFSDYLHPFGENHLIGIGREATEEGSVQGVKVSLFDISDFDNPKEIDKYVVEKDWSSSEAQYEHKAVLFDKERGILVIPVTYHERDGYSVYSYWQGAFVFNVDERSLSLRGMISHREEESEKEYWKYNGYVRRSLYMDDVLYTISQAKIRANEIFDLRDISEVELPYEA